MNNNPEVEFILEEMRAQSVKLLKESGVRVHTEQSGDQTVHVYTIVKDGREWVEAEYNAKREQMIWRGGHTTKRQDQCIRLHSELLILR